MRLRTGREAARNTKEGTLDLWHPVKDRSCLLNAAAAAAPDRCSACPLASEPPSTAELRALRRRSVAWADRFREREMHDKPFAAQRRDRDLARLSELTGQSTGKEGVHNHAHGHRV